MVDTLLIAASPATKLLFNLEKLLEFAGYLRFAAD